MKNHNPKMYTQPTLEYTHVLDDNNNIVLIPADSAPAYYNHHSERVNLAKCLQNNRCRTKAEKAETKDGEMLKVHVSDKFALPERNIIKYMDITLRHDRDKREEWQIKAIRDYYQSKNDNNIPENIRLAIELRAGLAALDKASYVVCTIAEKKKNNLGSPEVYDSTIQKAAKSGVSPWDTAEKNYLDSLRIRSHVQKIINIYFSENGDIISPEWLATTFGIGGKNTFDVFDCYSGEAVIEAASIIMQGLNNTDENCFVLIDKFDDEIVRTTQNKENMKSVLESIGNNGKREAIRSSYNNKITTFNSAIAKSVSDVISANGITSAGRDNSDMIIKYNLPPECQRALDTTSEMNKKNKKDNNRPHDEQAILKSLENYSLPLNEFDFDIFNDINFNTCDMALIKLISILKENNIPLERNIISRIMGYSAITIDKKLKNLKQKIIIALKISALEIDAYDNKKFKKQRLNEFEVSAKKIINLVSLTNVIDEDVTNEMKDIINDFISNGWAENEEKNVSVIFAKEFRKPESIYDSEDLSAQYGLKKEYNKPCNAVKYHPIHGNNNKIVGYMAEVLTPGKDGKYPAKGEFIRESFLNKEILNHNRRRYNINFYKKENNIVERWIEK